MTCPDENVLVAFAAARLPPELRAEVERHIDGCSLCGMLVAEAARGPDDQTRPPSSLSDEPTRPGRLLRGTSLGRYLVLEPLGSGGLGDVYACYDPELDRRVAIKLLKTTAAALDRAQLRLKREAQALARLAHPNVVAVHDVGIHDDRVFVAMELVEGQTLREWLSAAPRTWAEIRDVMAAAGRGLAAAHAAGMVHRDFKPGNMMVGVDGRVRVLDFGLARAVSPGAVSDASELASAARGTAGLDAAVTQTGVVLGTPAYMAPEQLTGASVDARADQFGFCCTLYEALLGKRPFAGRSLEEFDASIRAGPAVPHSGARVPAWLLRATLRGLSYEPDERFESMTALLHALERDRRSRRLRIAALAGMLVAGSVGVLVGRAIVPPSASERSVIDELTARVHEAAARGYFVYPPVEAPDEPTALRGVRRLEQERHAAAVERAEALRGELAQTLVRLGDHYWEREGGRPFAVEYYAQALVFDPEQGRANERAMLTASGVEALRARAIAGGFRPEELEAAAPLAALAQQEPDERRRRLGAVASRGVLPATVVVQLERLEPGVLDEGGADRAARAGAGTPPPPASPPSSPTPDPSPPASPELPPTPATDDVQVVDEAAKDHAPPSVERDADLRSGRRDPAVATRAAEQGRAALTRGGQAGLADAERAFHRALEADPRHAPALAGLAEVAFERGHFAKAERLARQAVRTEPRTGRYHLLLGDSLRRQAQYAEARTAYEAARELGHPSANKRLRSLEALTQGG